MFVSVRMQFHNHVDGGYQTRGTHVAHESILCGPQGGSSQ